MGVRHAKAGSAAAQQRKQRAAQPAAGLLLPVLLGLPGPGACAYARVRTHLSPESRSVAM